MKAYLYNIFFVSTSLLPLPNPQNIQVISTQHTSLELRSKDSLHKAIEHLAESSSEPITALALSKTIGVVTNDATHHQLMVREAQKYVAQRMLECRENITALRSCALLIGLAGTCTIGALHWLLYRPTSREWSTIATRFQEHGITIKSRFEHMGNKHTQYIDLHTPKQMSITPKMQADWGRLVTLQRWFDWLIPTEGTIAFIALLYLHEIGKRYYQIQNHYTRYQCMTTSIQQLKSTSQ